MLYNKFMSNESNLSNIVIQQLSPNDNFAQIADTLYLIDQYIFPDLFGDPDQAKIFAKPLFSDDPNALFSYSKTLVAKNSDGYAVRIAVYRDENCSPWDTETVKQRFEATGVELSKNFERASEKYMRKITDAKLPQGAVEIEFVGVHDDYRVQGIGSKLIHTIIDDPKYTEAHLDVLDSHPIAHQVYVKLGFQPVGAKFPNYPDGTEGVQHMVLKK